MGAAKIAELTEDVWAKAEALREARDELKRVLRGRKPPGKCGGTSPMASGPPLRCFRPAGHEMCCVAWYDDNGREVEVNFDADPGTKRKGVGR